MDLKAFKGLPHEFGGIDYTEGSEVEGGEFAVNIGKSGNEYIFDKNSSEGEKLSKEYKRLDMNGRLSEDDPLSLETFDQIAREEALKHAQRSVNEKGIDPFRNMYDQGGQAANGGVKYAAGGAKDMYVTGGGIGNLGSIMGGIGGGFNMIGDLFKTPDVNFDAMFTPDPGLTFANPQRYAQDFSNNSFQNTAPAGTQLMTEVGGLQSSVAPEYDIANIQQFESGIDDAELEEENEKKKKIEQGISAGAGIGSMIGGLVRGDSKAGQLKEPVSFRDPGDERSRSKGPEFHKMEGRDYVASHLEGAASGAMKGLQVAGPWGALGGAVLEGVINPIKDKLNEDKIQKEATEQFNRKLKEGADEGVRQSMMNAIAMDVDGTALIDKDRYAGVMRNGGAKKGVYGYYANGGGKKKEEEVSKDYANKIRKAEKDLNESLGRPMTKSTIDYFEQLNNNPRLAGDDIYLDPYRHGMAGYYTADAMRKKMPDWMPESVANKLAIAGSTIAGVGHEFTSPATERMGLVDGLTEAGEDAYNNYVGAKMIEDVLFDREAKQLMLDNIRKEKTYAGVVQSDSEPYTEFDPIPLSPKRFKNGGGKDKEELLTGPTGPTSNASATGIAVSPTGAAYSSDQMSLDNRGVGSSDYGVIPANLEQYARTFFGSNKQFTEKDMTPEEYKAAVDLYNIREKSHTIGYPDHDKVGSTNTSKAGMLSKLTNEPDIIRNLIGAAATKDGYITSDYNFGNKPFLEILKNLNAEDLMAWAHNNSPFVDSEAMAKKDAIKIKMPKNRK